MFGFVEGVIRWNIQVTAYTLTLVTDRYPPFRLAPLGSATRGSGRAASTGLFSPVGPARVGQRLPFA